MSIDSGYWETRIQEIVGEGALSFEPLEQCSVSLMFNDRVPNTWEGYSKAKKNLMRVLLKKSKTHLINTLVVLTKSLCSVEHGRLAIVWLQLLTFPLLIVLSEEQARAMFNLWRELTEPASVSGVNLRRNPALQQDYPYVAFEDCLGCQISLEFGMTVLEPFEL